MASSRSTDRVILGCGLTFCRAVLTHRPQPAPGAAVFFCAERAQLLFDNAWQRTAALRIGLARL